MKKYIDPNDYICSYHNIIRENLKKLSRVIVSQNLNNEKIDDLIEEMKISVKYAKKAGIKMENRLLKYKNTIEELGFERKYKK